MQNMFQRLVEQDRPAEKGGRKPRAPSTWRRSGRSVASRGTTLSQVAISGTVAVNRTRPRRVSEQLDDATGRPGHVEKVKICRYMAYSFRLLVSQRIRQDRMALASPSAWKAGGLPGLERSYSK